MKAKQIVKCAAVGLIGYTVGFYEMKYRITKLMLASTYDKEIEKGS